MSNFKWFGNTINSCYKHFSNNLIFSKTFLIELCFSLKIWTDCYEEDRFFLDDRLYLLFYFTTYKMS
jgi:hypothetical protein